jgi:hypothetical protein
MKGLLTSTERRRVQIINRLSLTTQWKPLDELALECDCSIKTLNQDFAFFKNNWENYFTVILDKKKGVRLQHTNVSKLDVVYSDILRSSQNFQFFEKLFFTPGKNAAYWANELYISESSLYRMVGLMNKEMSRSGVQINRQPFEAVGAEERWVRLQYGNYFMQAYGGIEWVFPDIDADMLVKVIHTVNEKAGYILNDEKMLRLIWTFAVSLERGKQGFLLEDKYRHLPDDEAETLLLSMEDLVQAGVDYPLPDKWHKGIARTLFHNRYAYDNEGERERIHNYLKNFVLMGSKTNHVPVSEEDVEHLAFEMSLLYTQYKSFPYVRYQMFNNYHHQAQVIQHLYPHFSNTFQKDLMQIERKTNFPWFSEYFDIILAMLFSDWSNLAITLEAAKPKVRMLFISTLGERHAKMMRDVVNIRYGEEVCAEIRKKSMVGFDERSHETFEDYDVIVSNTWYVGLPQDKLFVIDAVPNGVQMAELGKVIAVVQQRRNQNEPRRFDSEKEHQFNIA